MWLAAYGGAVMHFRIQCGFGPPFTHQTTDLARQLQQPDSPAARTYAELLQDFSPMTNWDGGHYLAIVREGYGHAYGHTPPRTGGNIAFFPLYPLLAAPLAPALGAPGALLVVSNVCAAAAAMLMAWWLCARLGRTAALWAVVLVFFWPTACFYSFAYSESLALLLIVAMLCAADRGAWFWAAVWCALATATRPTCVPMAPLLGLAAFHVCGYGVIARAIRSLGLTLIALSGAAAYAIYLTWRFGSPFVYLDNFRLGWAEQHVASTWTEFLTLARVWDQFKYLGRALRDLPVSLTQLANPIAWNMPLSFFLVIAGCLVFVAALRAARTARGSVGASPREHTPPDIRGSRPDRFFVTLAYFALTPLGVFAQRYAASGTSSFALESMARYVGLSAAVLIACAILLAQRRSSFASVSMAAMLLVMQVIWAAAFGMHEWTG